MMDILRDILVRLWISTACLDIHDSWPLGAGCATLRWICKKGASNGGHY